MTSLRPVLGTNACALIGVAEPKRLQDRAPSTSRSAAGIQPAIAPTLLSHLPMLRPTTFNVTAIVRPASETRMKYVLLVDKNCHDDPPMNSTLAAAK